MTICCLSFALCHSWGQIVDEKRFLNLIETEKKYAALKAEVDSIIKANERLQRSDNKLKELQKAYELLEDSIPKLNKKIKGMGDEIKETAPLKGENEDLKKEKEDWEAQKTTLEGQLKSKEAELNTQKEKVARFAEVEAANKTLENANNEYKAKEKQQNRRIEALEGELKEEQDRSKAYKTNIEKFKTFADDVIKKLEADVAALLSAGDPADAGIGDKISGLKGRVGLMSGIAEPPAKLDELLADIKTFEQAMESIRQAKQVLLADFDRSKNQAALAAISGIKPPLVNNPNISGQKINLEHLLKNYCACYKEAYSYFENMRSYDKVLDEDMVYFEKYEYKIAKPAIKIADSYPFIKSQLNQLRTTPESKRKLKQNPFREIKCNP